MKVEGGFWGDGEQDQQAAVGETAALTVTEGGAGPARTKPIMFRFLLYYQN